MVRSNTTNEYGVLQLTRTLMAIMLLVVVSVNANNEQHAPATNDNTNNAPVTVDSSSDNEVSLPSYPEGVPLMDFGDETQFIQSKPTWRTPASFTDRRRTLIESWIPRLKQAGGPTAIGRQEIIDRIAEEIFEMLEFAWTGHYRPFDSFHYSPSTDILICMDMLLYYEQEIISCGSYQRKT
jgi:hypothetical protein